MPPGGIASITGSDRVARSTARGHPMPAQLIVPLHRWAILVLKLAFGPPITRSEPLLLFPIEASDNWQGRHFGCVILQDLFSQTDRQIIENNNE
jgi:hypothetical protein